jgi:hypothetical protein
VNRRDFLLLRRVPASRIVDLSCQQLYMRYLDTQVTGERRDADADTTTDPWGGEPPPVFDERTFADVLHAIEDGLRDADVVRLNESAWLACDEVTRGLDGALAAFRTRGGRVEIRNSELGIKNSSPNSEPIPNP